MKAIIVGGGIGGLASAVALSRDGWQVEVLERAPAFTEAGAGLSLWPNALRALDALGVAGAIRGRARLEGQAGIRDASGRRLSRTDVAELERRYGQVAMIHRADLLAVLCAAVPGAALRPGITVSRVGADGTVVHSGGESHADLVVGADGINSVVRTSIWPDAPAPRCVGYTSWRVVTPPVRVSDGGESWGRGERFGYRPGRQRPCTRPFNYRNARLHHARRQWPASRPGTQSAQQSRAQSMTRLTGSRTSAIPMMSARPRSPMGAGQPSFTDVLADPRVRLGVSTAALLVTAMAARRDDVSLGEARVFRAVNGLPDSLYLPAWAIMQLGTLGAAPAAAAAAWLAEDGELAGRLLASGTGTWALSKLVKQIVRRPRPAALLAGTRSRGRDAAGLGYLSGHAGVAVALGAAALPHLSRAGCALALTTIPIVGLTRIYVGAHLPLDIAGGAALGVAVEAAVSLAESRTRCASRTLRQRPLSLQPPSGSWAIQGQQNNSVSGSVPEPG
jgi:membrane-associated phospholipid phosphatase